MNQNPQPEPEEVVVPSQAPRRARWGLRLSVVLVILLAFAVVANVIWGETERRRLDAQLAAYRAAGEPTSVEELNRWPATVSGSGENALTVLRKAGEAVDETSKSYRDYLAAESLLPLTDKEVEIYEALLKGNPGALAAVERAVTMPRVDWELALTSPMFADLGGKGQLDPLRRLTNLLHADAMLAHQRGDDARALRRAGQILFVARAMGHYPTVIGYLMSLGMSAQASSVASEIAPDVSLSQPGARDAATMLIAELLDERAIADARHRGFVGERVLQVDGVFALTQGRVNFKELMPKGTRAYNSGDDDDRSEVGLKVVGRLMRPVFFENGRAMAAYMTDVVRVLPQCPDWPTYQAKAPPSPKGSRGVARNLLLDVLLPTLDRAVTAYYRCAGDRRLAATCLAARLYAADHGGRLPETLQDLVPTYLPAVPLDPFTAGKPLLYVNASSDPDKPRVYGVGENGVDNGGIEPDKRLRRVDYNKLVDEIRYLKRQPRPKPEEPFGGLAPGMFPPGSFPGGAIPTPPPGEPGEAADEPASTQPDAPPAAPTPPAEQP